MMMGLEQVEVVTKHLIVEVLIHKLKMLCQAQVRRGHHLLTAPLGRRDHLNQKNQDSQDGIPPAQIQPPQTTSAPTVVEKPAPKPSETKQSKSKENMDKVHDIFGPDAVKLLIMSHAEVNKALRDSQVEVEKLRKQLGYKSTTQAMRDGIMNLISGHEVKIIEYSRTLSERNLLIKEMEKALGISANEATSLIISLREVEKAKEKASARKE